MLRLFLQGSHLSEQLDVFRQQFRETTDRLISTIETTYDVPLAQEWSQMQSDPSVDYADRKAVDDLKTAADVENERPRSGSGNVRRRASIFGPSNPVDRTSLLGITERHEPGSETSCSFRSSGSQKLFDNNLLIRNNYR